MSPEDDFRQLVSSDHLFRFSKMTYRGLDNFGLGQAGIGYNRMGTIILKDDFLQTILYRSFLEALIPVNGGHCIYYRTERFLLL